MTHRLNRGSLTLELAVIMPILMAMLIGIVQLGSFLIQVSRVRAIAEETAAGLARVWFIDHEEAYGSTLRRGDVGVESIAQREKYWWITSLAGAKGKTQAAEEIVRERLEREVTLPRMASADFNRLEVDVIWHPGLTGGTVSVAISLPVRIPATGWMTFSDRSGNTAICASSRATVQDPRAFINQTDFAIQKLMSSEFGGTLLEKVIEPLSRGLRALIGNE